MHVTRQIESCREPWIDVCSWCRAALGALANMALPWPGIDHRQPCPPERRALIAAPVVDAINLHPQVSAVFKHCSQPSSHLLIAYQNAHHEQLALFSQQLQQRQQQQQESLGKVGSKRRFEEVDSDDGVAAAVRVRARK